MGEMEDTPTETYQSLQRHGQRKPTEAVGSSVVAAVIIEMTKSKLAISVFPSMTYRFDRWKDGVETGTSL